jgi:multidrug efflux pump subunit AcrA (membrane-fusion protein)
MESMANTITKIKRLIEPKIRLVLILFTLISLAVLGAIAIPLIGVGDGLSGIKTVQVSSGSISETVNALGTVSAMPNATLAWQSNGIISGFDLKVGDQVEKGQVLLTLDDSSISAEILQARTSLLEAQIDYQKLMDANTDYLTALQEVNTQQVILENTYSMRHEFYDENTSDARIDGIYASYTQARVDVWDLEEKYDQVKDLDEDDPEKTAAYETLQAGILKRDSLLRAMNQIMGTPYGQRAEGYFILYDQRVAELAQARATAQRLLDNSGELSAAQAKFQALQNTVDQAKIIAPFSGTVTKIQAVAGGKATNGEIAVQLDSLSNMVIHVEISQMDINRVSIGQTAEITFNALTSEIFDGVVKEVSGASASSGNGSVFKVQILILNPGEEVKPGFTASVSIITRQVNDTLLVPNQAIQYKDDGSAYVMLEAGLGQHKEISIQTGAKSDAYSELTAGDLVEGDSLLVAAESGESFQVGSGDALREARRIYSGR